MAENYVFKPQQVKIKVSQKIKSKKGTFWFYFFKPLIYNVICIR